jgi:uncharacterized membrane-anchored protein YhcB (DUF1043 family)
MQTNYIEIVMALLVGVLLGMLISRLSSRNKSKVEPLTKELEQRNQELLQIKEQLQHMVQRDREMSGYKSQVDDHFVETAALINQMTQSYKAVYDHLEKGAVALVGRENLQKRLGNIRSEPVKLEYIGLSHQDTETEQPGYVVVLEQALPENEQLLEKLAKALEVLPQDVAEALNGVMSQAMAKRLEQILHEYGISVGLRTTPELFNSSNV